MSLVRSLLRQRWHVGAAVIAAALGSTACSHLHGGHDHAGQQGALSLNEGKKWPTDAPLRLGMSSVRKLAAAVPEGSTPSDEAARRLADGVRDQIAFMVSNCKLEPKADAVLHVMIADLSTAADELASPATRPAGLQRIRKALQQYPEYFAPAGW